MLFIYKLHISQSQHLQKQCQKNGVVGYNFPPLQFPSIMKAALPTLISFL